MKYQTAGAFVITHKSKNRRKARREGDEFIRQMKDALKSVDIENVVMVGYTDPKREQEQF